MTAGNDHRALIEQARLDHEESLSKPGQCHNCWKPWPCIPSRLAEALEQTLRTVNQESIACAYCSFEIPAPAEAAAAQAHVLVCEFNPISIRLREAEARAEQAERAAAESDAKEKALRVWCRRTHVLPICGNTALDEQSEAIVRSMRAEAGGAPEGGCGQLIEWLMAYRCLECGRWMHAECLRQHFVEHGDTQAEAVQAMARAEAEITRLQGVCSERYDTMMEYAKQATGYEIEAMQAKHQRDALARELAAAREQLDLASDRRDEALDRALAAEVDNVLLQEKLATTREVLADIYEWASTPGEGERYVWIKARTSAALAAQGEGTEQSAECPLEAHREAHNLPEHRFIEDFQRFCRVCGLTESHGRHA